MNKTRISFDVEVTAVSGMTDEHLAKDVRRMLDVYARSHGLCIDNVSLTSSKNLPAPWGWLQQERL